MLAPDRRVTERRVKAYIEIQYMGTRPLMQPVWNESDPGMQTRSVSSISSLFD